MKQDTVERDDEITLYHSNEQSFIEVTDRTATYLYGIKNKMLRTQINWYQLLKMVSKLCLKNNILATIELETITFGLANRGQTFVIFFGQNLQQQMAGRSPDDGII